MVSTYVCICILASLEGTYYPSSIVCMYSETCLIRHPVGNAKQCWIIEVSLYGKLIVGAENLDRFRRMLVYRGAGLGRFHCMLTV